MNTVFSISSKRLGGTSVNPRYIGVMCAYYDMMAEKDAIPELLIHEFTHNALFLDEYCVMAITRIIKNSVIHQPI